MSFRGAPCVSEVNLAPGVVALELRELLDELRDLFAARGWDVDQKVDVEIARRAAFARDGNPCLEASRSLTALRALRAP